ncbi:hypothetical protein L6164_028786 [Bauhinia variegata]|uniref:Uncharacterized protein n=1 Tax=Bauhinia variegata TaxID=167791 RepID=A0ACB9L790_BAUVA|nr:hypothetical protein L6164_028786 [Bauhinia variegata]
MAVAGVAFNGIVPELLTNDNYERWSVLMKNYLIGHGLWNVVLSPPDRGNEEWQKKNALALYSIQLSCGPYAFSKVQKCETAKIAWGQLKLFCTTYNKIGQDIEEGMPQDSVSEEEKKLYRKIIDAIRNRGLDVLDDTYLSIKYDMTKVSRTDQYGNNIFRMAAESRPSSSDGRSSCAALQMQRATVL